MNAATWPTMGVICRQAHRRDAVAMWRLVRHGTLGSSPFAYMALVRRFVRTTVVAEVDDVLIAFVLGRCDGSSTVHLLDAGVDSSADPAVLMQLLGCLAHLPACGGALFFEAACRGNPLLYRTLVAFGDATRAVIRPLAKVRVDPASHQGRGSSSRVTVPLPT
jgi:hypothetical protein